MFYEESHQLNNAYCKLVIPGIQQCSTVYVLLPGTVSIQLYVRLPGTDFGDIRTVYYLNVYYSAYNFDIEPVF
jgi:hypothetical protein